MSSSTTTSRRIEIEHIRIESRKASTKCGGRSNRLFRNGTRLSRTALQRDDEERVEDERQHGPELALFLTRDHGRLLAIYGRARKAYQYEIGNPITAASMTEHQLAAALYAPLRVALYEDERGRGVFEYDRPSALLGQFGDERVTEVARALDEESRGYSAAGCSLTSPGAVIFSTGQSRPTDS